MKFWLKGFVVILASYVMLGQGFCEDASDTFLKAFQAFQTGDRLERDAKPREALEKYRTAAELLGQISKSEPDWQPLVVEYRLKKSQESITRLEATVSSLPPETQPVEGPLPEADKSGPTVSTEPSVSVTPPARTSRSQISRPQQWPVTSEDSSTYSSGGESSSRTLRRQLADAQRDNARLTDKLDKVIAERQSALLEVDKTKVTVVELKSQLSQLSEVLENSKKDGDSFRALREQYDKQVNDLNSRLANAQADKDVLQDENDRLFAKLDQASKYIQGSDTIREGLLKERQGLAAARDTAVAKAKRIKDNAAQIEKVTEENEKIATENKTLKKKVASLQDDLTEVKENSTDKKEIKRLTAENTGLQEKLTQAQKSAQEAAAASPEKDKVIASLQSELNGVNDKLLEAQAQSQQSEAKTKELQKQLDQTEGQLAQVKLNPSPSREEKNLSAENEVLRGIILRQIKEQTQRDEARKKLDQEVAKLQIKSDIINQQIEVLGTPVLQLTPEERSLFKEPVALLNEPSASSLDVNMVVVKPTKDEAAKAGDHKDAKPNGAEALPDSARDLVQQASKQFYNKNYAAAEKLYQQIVEAAPDNYFALSNLGAVQIEAGKLSAAEVALKKALDINSKDSFAHTYLGVVYCKQGQFDDAIAALRQAIVLNDNDSMAHNYLGVCLGQHDDKAGAEREFKRAIELKSDYADAHFNLAVLYATNQPPALDLAKLHYSKATELGAAPDPSLERLIQ